MNLGKFFKTKSGMYLMSVILGFGLATLFRTVCQGKNCIVFEAPDLDLIKGKVFRYGTKCYKYEETVTACDGTKETARPSRTV